MRRASLFVAFPWRLCGARTITLRFIDPGKLMQNAHCLLGRVDACRIAEEWRQDDNWDRFQGASGFQRPSALAGCAAMAAAGPAGIDLWRLRQFQAVAARRALIFPALTLTAAPSCAVAVSRNLISGGLRSAATPGMIPRP